MPGSWTWPPQTFPNLSAQNSEKTSEKAPRYNCIAWAAGVITQFWWPDPVAIANKEAVWPAGVPIDLTIDAFLLAFETKGFAQCADARLEHGVEKIAIYGTVNANAGIEPTHAARQLPDGSWTSKLGRNVDIRHTTLDAIDGPLYGTAIAYMRRPIQTAVSASPDKARVKRRRKAKAARAARRRSKRTRSMMITRVDLSFR